jgi:hypothetical protein
MRKMGTVQAEVDATKIIEDTDDFLVVPATIAREGVFKYPDGMAFKPKEELKKYAWTFDGAWIVPDQHPDTKILMDPDRIVGKIEKPSFCDKINGIRGDLRFEKKKADAQFLADIKSGKKKDVSIGFFYVEDQTPGEFQGQKYDYVQRKFLGNHIAAGVPVGRCPSPYCGITVDAIFVKPIFFPTIKFKGSDGKEILPGEWADLFDHLPATFFFPATDNVAADPWEETEEYIRSGHKEPGETCRTIDISEDQGIKAIYCKYGEDWAIQSYLFSKAKDWTVEKAKAWFEAHKDQKATDQEQNAKEAAGTRCAKYPVSFKEGVGNVTKPSEFESISEGQFADPCNFKYPIDAEHVMAAWAYISKDENRAAGGYSEEEWTWMKNRVKKAMETKGHEVQTDAETELERSRRLLES